MPLSSNTELLYWEDFPVGSVRELGGRSLSAADIVRFASEFDPQPFHLDEAAGAASHFGGLVASGWHTCATLMRMMCDDYLLKSSSMGSPGIDQLRWLKPVRPGDQLRARMTVLQARPMGNKPHIGLVQSQWEMLNQNDEIVLTMQGWGMFGRRPA
jgi:acyl dehydratase